MLWIGQRCGWMCVLLFWGNLKARLGREVDQSTQPGPGCLPIQIHTHPVNIVTSWPSDCESWREGHLISASKLLPAASQVLEHYANSLANTIVYARCFVEELNKTADLCKQVTDLPLMLGFTIDRHIDRLLMRRPHRPLDIVSVLLFRFFGRR